MFARTFAPLLVLLALAPSSAHALDRVGARIGLRFDPDQVVIGSHLALFDLTPDVRVRGSASLGFGSDVTILDLSGEIHYVARSAPLAADTYFYAGGGPDLANTWFDGGDGTSSDTDLGIVLLGGIERAIGTSALFGEFRLHIHDADEWFELHLGLDLSLGP